MNKQEIFDIVSRHLLTQNEQAISGITCRYRTTDGLKCAVGCLIPDELYDPIIEGIAVNTDAHSVSINKESLKLFNKILDTIPVDREFLIELQNLHDGYFPDLWPEKLTQLGEKYGLTINF